MNLGRCMLRECKTCKFETRCFKEYQNEYTKNKKFVSIISFTTEVLAGIPSIIYGLFGMLFFGSFCHLNFSILTGSLTLAIMILPIISRNTQTALECVPKSYREAALGIGATKWYMIRTVLLPSAIPGILTGAVSYTHLTLPTT